MANTIRIKRRAWAAGGSSGAPSSLSSGELAYNENDRTLYIGSGSSGGATVLPVAGDGLNYFITNADNTASGDNSFTGANTFSNAIIANGGVTGDVTGDLTGNADSATILANTRTIAGQNFNGSQNVSIAPTDLTGVTASAAELNLLDDVTGLVKADFTKLAAVTASAASINRTSSIGTTYGNLVQIDSGDAAAYAGLLAKFTNSGIDSVSNADVKTQLALNNVDNTSDADKPVSTAGQTALNLKANIASPTFTGDADFGGDATIEDDLIITSGRLVGPSTFYIDPLPIDSGTGEDDSPTPSGTVVIRGDFRVDGTTTTVNSTAVEINDLTLTLAGDADQSSDVDGAGIILGANSDVTFLYDDLLGNMDLSTGLDINGGLICSGINTGSDDITTTGTVNAGTINLATIDGGTF